MFSFAPLPNTVVGLSSAVTAMAAGSGQTCAVLQTGALRCWGRNNYGQVGNNFHTDSLYPSAVVGLDSGISGVAAGGVHTCALTVSGGVKCWGDNSSGELGNNTNTIGGGNVIGFAREIPTLITGNNHSCAMTDAGTVSCWGYNDFGKLGNAGLVDAGTYPAAQPVAGLTSATKSLGLGNSHSCALVTGSTPANTVACWGSNQYGELGNGVTIPAAPSAIPVIVQGSQYAVAMSTGGTHSCLLYDYPGSIYCWGRNNRGQLGDGTTTSSSIPRSALSQARAIAAGGEHTCALGNSSIYSFAVFCWGANQSGQLGNNSTVDSFFPGGVNGLGNDVLALTAGEAHTCALKADGTVMCWGDNSNYQLAVGAPAQSLVPIVSFTGAVAVAAGKQHTCILTRVGAVQCAGRNADGELGIGIFEPRRFTPLGFVPQFSGGVAAIATGSFTSFALLPDGTAYGWGSGDLGRLGNNSTNARFALPVQVLGNNGAGFLRLRSTDTVPDLFTLQSRFGVGRNEVVESNPVTVSGITSAAAVSVAGGQISINNGAYFAGPGTVVNGGQVRVRVTASSGYDTNTIATLSIGGLAATFQVRTRKNPIDGPAVPAAALGENFTLILGSNGLVYAAGYNGARQMGNGSTLNATAPGVVAGLTNMRRIAAGSNHALGLRADGTVYAWGYNAGGQLGGASNANSSGNPTLVAGISAVQAIASGQNHSLALKSDNTLWAWGLNAEGQLGTGNTISTSTPVQVLTAVRAIAAGGRHTLAIKTDGTLWTWGANESGQLGSGNTTARATPTQVGVINNWLAVAAGGAHSLALRSDGTVYAFGANAKGQLGDATTMAKNVPTQIPSFTAVASIAAGAEHSLALRVGGIAYAWGANDNSQLGNGNTTLQNVPSLITNQGGLIAIAGGGGHSAALTKFGELLVWGRNEDGQIGIRTPVTRGGPQTIDTGKGRAKISNIIPGGGTGTSNGIPSSGGSGVLRLQELGYYSGDFGFSPLLVNKRSSRNIDPL